MYSILIADDEIYIRQGLKKFLDWEKYGFRIIGDAKNGLEAKKLFEKEPADIIITDIKMPNMNGFELIDSFSDFDKRPYFIILSGYSEFEYAQKAIERSVIHYLLKPLQEDELIYVLRKIKNKLDRLSQISQQSTISTNLLEKCRAGKKRKILYEMILFMEKNMSKNITLESMEEQFHMNQNYICQMFKRLLGVNFLDLLTMIRIEKAKTLLDDLSLKIYDVSYMVGYYDPRYFSQVFKKYTDMTPTEYREKI